MAGFSDMQATTAAQLTGRGIGHHPGPEVVQDRKRKVCTDCSNGPALFS